VLVYPPFLKSFEINLESNFANTNLRLNITNQSLLQQYVISQIVFFVYYKMVYITPTINYFTHGNPYIVGNCQQCICATLQGQQCVRKTCGHQSCCWQHSKGNNALYNSVLEYQEEMLRIDNLTLANRTVALQEARNGFQQLHYNLIRDRYLVLTEKLSQVQARRNRGTQTLEKNIEILASILNEYRRANAQQSIFIQLMQNNEIPDSNVIIAYNPLNHNPVDGRLPDIILDRNLDNEQLQERLIEYWQTHCNMNVSRLSESLEDMNLNDLKSIVIIESQCFSGPENHMLPPIVLDQGDLDDIIYKNQLIKYWQGFSQEDHDVIMTADFEQMSLDELKSIIIINNRIFSSEALYTFWTRSVEERSVFRHPLTSAPFSEDEKDLILRARRSIGQDVPYVQILPQDIQPYNDGMRWAIEDSDSHLGFFINLWIVDIDDNDFYLGCVPFEVKLGGNSYADTDVITSQIRTLFMTHRLFTHEPINIDDIVVRRDVQIPQSVEAWHWRYDPSHPYELAIHEPEDERADINASPPHIRGISTELIQSLSAQMREILVDDLW
jgi:hypothetical protein